MIIHLYNFFTQEIFLWTQVKSRCFPHCETQQPETAAASGKGIKFGVEGRAAMVFFFFFCFWLCRRIGNPACLVWCSCVRKKCSFLLHSLIHVCMSWHNQFIIYRSSASQERRFQNQRCCRRRNHNCYRTCPCHLLERLQGCSCRYESLDLRRGIQLAVNKVTDVHTVRYVTLRHVHSFCLQCRDA